MPASRDGSDEITIGAEDLAQRGDLGLEVVFLDDAIRPHAPHQPVLVDDGAARVDQRDQRVEGSPAQLDGPAVDEQLTPMTDNLESTELQRGGRMRRIHGPQLYPACQGSSGRISPRRGHQPRQAQRLKQRPRRDRKSTRLNSSHGYISYAV